MYEVIILSAFWIYFTVSLRLEDDHRDRGGRLEGFVHEKQLFGGGQRGKEWRQLFECDVGWQSGLQGQHGRCDAVGQQAFWLHTEKRRDRKRKSMWSFCTGDHFFEMCRM